MAKKHRQTFTFQGKTIDRKFDKKSDAAEWYAMMKRKADRVKAGLPMGVDDLPVRLAAAKWIALREKTADFWMNDNSKMRELVPRFADKTVQGTTKGDCEAVLHGARIELKLAGATFNRYRACLHTFFEFCVDEGYRETNPVGRIDRMPELERGAFISDESVVAYVSHLEAAEAPVFFVFLLLGMNCGARPGELLALTWSDYQPDSARIVIHKRYQRQLGRVKEGTKGGSGRQVPLDTLVIAELEQYRATLKKVGPDDPIFQREDGTLMSDRTLHTVHQRAAKAAGLAKTVRVYDITRHKFASEVTRKFGLRAAQELLGHSTSAITERYSHAEPGALVNRVLGNISIGFDSEKQPIATSEKDGGKLGHAQDYSHTSQGKKKEEKNGND